MSSKAIPDPVTQLRQFEEVRDALREQPLSSVTNLVNSRCGAEIDSVTIYAGRKAVRLRWAHSMVGEGLAVEIDELSDAGLLRSVDQSSNYGWRARIGATIRDVLPVWQPGEQQQRLLCAVTLDFGSQADPVSIALGRRTGTEIEYSPDELVVIFDQLSARRYFRASDALP